MVRELSNSIQQNGVVEHKLLESHGGFLIYVARTYWWMQSYMRGILLTLNSWRLGRDEDSWKLTKAELKAIDREMREWADEHGEEEEWPTKPSQHQQAPSALTPVPRLISDLEALEKLTSLPKPPLSFVRSNLIMVALYRGRDASGAGFGGAIHMRDGIMVRHGMWGRDAEGDSSNFQELRNLVEHVEKAVMQGGLKGVELFLYMDNSTAEVAYYNRSLGNKHLDALVVCLKKVEANKGMHVHFLHIAGTQMIELGINRLLRGSLMEGVMRDVFEGSGAVLIHGQLYCQGGILQQIFGQQAS